MTHQERADLALRNASNAVERALRRHGDSSGVTISDAEFDDILTDLEQFAVHVDQLVDGKISEAAKAAAAASPSEQPAPA